MVHLYMEGSRPEPVELLCVEEPVLVAVTVCETVCEAVWDPVGETVCGDAVCDGVKLQRSRYVQIAT